MQGGAANRASAVVLGAAALALRAGPGGRRGLTVKTIANGLRISCGRSCLGPNNLRSLEALTEGAARAAPCAYPARRLHARVRRQTRPHPKLAETDTGSYGARASLGKGRAGVTSRLRKRHLPRSY